LAIKRFVVAALVLSAVGVIAQAPATAAARPKFEAFDVATIKPVENQDKAPRYFKMEGTHRFVAKYYNLKLLIAAAYDLNPKTISGGPGWVESARFDILGITPGEVIPNRQEQMAMLRTLLTERFKLTFHREPKEYSIYALELAKGGPKLTASTAPADDPPRVISTVYPDKIVLPAHNASMEDFTAMLQRAMLDRPVVDKTGLMRRYDFMLEFAPDETVFGGEITAAASDTPSVPLFTAIQEQIGLKLEATRGPVSALVIDGAQRPTAD
jgi:uncharacterized protein (TIGR03435 family)